MTAREKLNRRMNEYKRIVEMDVTDIASSLARGNIEAIKFVLSLLDEHPLLEEVIEVETIFMIIAGSGFEQPIIKDDIPAIAAKLKEQREKL